MVGMNGDELADSGEDFVVTAAGLLLGWWVGVASRPRDSKTADMPSPNSRGELGAGGWGCARPRSIPNHMTQMSNNAEKEIASSPHIICKQIVSNI